VENFTSAVSKMADSFAATRGSTGAPSPGAGSLAATAQQLRVVASPARHSGGLGIKWSLILLSGFIRLIKYRGRILLISFAVGEWFQQESRSCSEAARLMVLNPISCHGTEMINRFCVSPSVGAVPSSPRS